VSVGFASAVWCFDRFRLDLGRGALLDADGAEIALRPKAFALLCLLVENAGRLVDRDEIMRIVWPDVVVADDSIAQCVKQIRQALGDEEMRLLRTLPRRGFLFAAEVRRLDAPPGAESEPTPPRPDALTDRPTLAVLPFANMTADPEQDYFADGVTEELTTELSHLRWFSVIARNSAFTYKGRAVDVREVGRELGVGYVLEGSVRKAGGRVRITAQLCEAESGRHIWAQRFEGDLADVFDLQDRVTEAVAAAIEPSLQFAEAERRRARPTESLGAYDLYLRALPHRWFGTREASADALALLRRALTLDPGFAAALGAMAGLAVIRVSQGWAEAGEAEEGLRCARALLEGGGTDNPSALAWAGYAVTYLGRAYEAGLAAADRALRLAPNSATVLFLAGWNSLYVGDWRTAVARLERALRLSPVDPLTFKFQTALSGAYFVGAHYEEAAENARSALHGSPVYLTAHRLLAASLALLGRTQEAEAAMQALRAIGPDETLAKLAATTALRGEARERLLDGLRRAGMPA
jgi:TolB-like protein